MKKTYRLAFNWLEHWRTSLAQLNASNNNDALLFWTGVSEAISATPDGLTEAELKLY